MRKEDLARLIAKRNGLRIYQATSLLDFIFDAIKKEVSQGGEVMIRGFGVFRAKQRKAKSAQNFNTGKTITIPARRLAVFKPSKRFKCK